MIIATHLPRAPLDQFIELLWFHEDLNSPHRFERVLPEGSVELIINLRDQNRHIFDPVSYQAQQSYRRSWLSGPHSKFIVIDTAPNASMIGVHFKPGGANAFFSMPLNELRNNVVALDVFWNGAAASLRDQLLEAPTATDKFRILEDALLARRRGAELAHPAVRYALGHFIRQSQILSVGAITDQISLSPRRFIELFNDQVGMTPKVFCRVRRFQRALFEIQRRRNLKWAELAPDCGYYDQAHFICDFKEFCGLTPADYLNKAPQYPNFVPILA
jgi:AraC-like DNA-binding protein